VNLTKFKEQVKGGPSAKYQNTVLFSPAADSAQGVSKVQSFKLSESRLYDNLIFPSETDEKLYMLSPSLLPRSKVFVIPCCLFAGPSC